MEKDIYYLPSSFRNKDELDWLRFSESGRLWIYQSSEGKEKTAEDMMLNKLIANPKVLNDEPENYAILKHSGQERLGALMKCLPVKSVMLMGVDPKSLGIHFPLNAYEIIRHQDLDFLLMDSPERMPELPPATKGKIVSLLQALYARSS